MRFWAHFNMHPRDVDRLAWDEAEWFDAIADERDKQRG